MMNSKVRKMISVVMTAMLATSMLAGCGSKKEEVQAAGNKESEVTGFHKEGLPIVDSPVELEVLTMRWSNMGDTFTKNQWLVDLEKNTNVKVNWQVVSSNDWNEQKSILLASGELPEVILGGQTFSDTDILGNIEYFVPLEDLIDKHMPNLKAAMEKTPALRQIVTASDGHIYSLPAREMYSSKCVSQAIINKKWLKNLGLEVPQNTDDLYKVLKAFKEQDANGNGDPNDEIPYTAKGLEMSFLMPFGINSSNYMGVLDGEPVYYPVTDQFKEGVEYMHKLYSEGLLDQEMFTQDGTMKTAKQQNSDVPLVGFAYEWIPDAVFGKWGEEYVAIPALAGPDGQRCQQGDVKSNGISRNQLLITKFCKNPEIVARWADQWYTDEATIQNQWGAVGTVMKANEDGTYEIMDPPAGTSADEWYWEQCLRSFGPKYASDAFQQKVILPENSGDGLKTKISKMSEAYVTDAFPNVMFTTEETEELAMLNTDLNNYIVATAAKWVTEGGIEQDRDAFIKKLKDMGLDRYMEINKAAYDRYQAQK